MAGKFTKTERFLLLLAAVFLTALAALYLLALKPAAGSDYTVTAQYQTESPQEALVNINTADQEELEALSAVMGLPEQYRLPIHLHYYEGYGIV